MRNILTPPVVLASVLAATVAAAAPPVDSPGTYRSWFESLRQPKTGDGCCSIADCRHYPYRQGPGGWEVWVEFPGMTDPNGQAHPVARWLAVPNDVVLHRENPTGEPIACIWGSEVRCFVTPPET